MPTARARRGARQRAETSSSRPQHVAVQPYDVVPREHPLGPVEQRGIAAAAAREREAAHTILGIRRHVAQDVEDLLLPGDLERAGIGGGVEARLPRLAAVGDAALEG